MKQPVTRFGSIWLILGWSMAIASVPPARGESEQPDRWQPAPGDTWQWQLQDDIDPTIEAAIYDIDLFDATPRTIAALKADGRHLICYVSVGLGYSAILKGRDLDAPRVACAS